MAESDSGQERTEEPTEKRKSDAREKGQIPRSRELNTAFVVISGAAIILTMGSVVGKDIIAIMSSLFDIQRSDVFDTSFMVKSLSYALKTALLALIPVFIILIIAALAGAGVLGGIKPNLQSLQPKLERMDPIAGMKRIFSVKGLMELVKAMGKFFVIATFAVLLLYSQHETILRLAFEPLRPGVIHAMTILAWSVLGLATTLVIIAAIDVPFQLWDNKRQLKMTRQELKDEFKETEGNPEVRQKVRRMQEEVAKRKMMKAVPEADVVITNPTHYAIALRYNQDEDNAPIVVAKGLDHMALNIIKIAKANEVEVFGAPPLARALYYSSKVDGEVPFGLYVAVAQILAYVYQIRLYRKGKARRPKEVTDLPIPDDLRH